MVDYEFGFQRKKYVLKADGGKIVEIKVAYHRVHGAQHIGVLRSLWPGKGQPSKNTLAVLKQANELWEVYHRQLNKMEG